MGVGISTHKGQERGGVCAIISSITIQEGGGGGGLVQ